jgi:hypothetical protein
VAGEIDDGDRAVGLIGDVGAASVGQRVTDAGIVAYRNGVRGAESGAVIAVLIEADVDDADGVAIVVGYDELLCCRSRTRRRPGRRQLEDQPSRSAA